MDEDAELEMEQLDRELDWQSLEATAREFWARGPSEEVASAKLRSEFMAGQREKESAQ